MGFVDRLEQYLSLVQRTGAGLVPIPSSAAKAAMISALEKQSPVTASPATLRKLDEWQQDDRVVRFAERLATLLRDSFGHDVSDSELERWVGIGIARQLGADKPLSTPVRTAELDRLAKVAYEEIFSGGINIPAYAAAIRATRRTTSGLELTPVGRVFLELTGRDAIRWLLSIEIEQSTGPNDDWRISRELVRDLIEVPHRFLNWNIEDDGFSYSWASVQRLEQLDVVGITKDENSETTDIDVSSSAQELLKELVGERESPLTVMAKTVIADLTMAATQVASPERARATTGVEAAARQARLVAHEIRNALLPVKTSVTALYREVLINSPTEAIGKRRETIDRGIEEIFHFVDELVKVSALTAAPPEPFELGAVIRDSLSAVRFPTNINVEVDSALELPFVSGQRNRVVLAIVNILRNAVQHGNGKVLRINVHAEPIDGARAVRLTIEDDGPGVPEAMRQAIFTEGLSLRPGGSGLGLTLVREIFEKEMNGIISCDASPLGGARFIIRLPTSGTTR